MTQRNLFAALIVLGLASVSQPALAAIYLVDYTSASGVFSGVVTTTDTADSNGFYKITSFTGQEDGADITWHPGDLPQNDLFKPTASYFSPYGTVYSVGSVYYYLYQYDGKPVIEGVGDATSYRPAYVTSFSVTAVPEPATWAMMIGGFALIGGAMRQRRQVRVAFA